MTISKSSDINGETQLIGLMGWPVAHTFSPAMHNAAARALGLNWVYVPLAVRPDDVRAAIQGLPALGFRGVNITVPHKQAVMPFLAGIEEGAQAIGAVNTIVIDGGARQLQLGKRRLELVRQLTGYNTDWSGFLADLENLEVVAAGRACLILGAGGSARAVAYGLASAGGRVSVLARRVEQAQQLVADLSPYFEQGSLTHGPLSDLATVAGTLTAPLIVNTTPVGMVPDTGSSIWPDDLAFPQNAFVYDLVYNPAETRLMAQARAAGCGTANGLGMLIQQGALAFQLWTEQAPDTAVMAEAIRAMKEEE